MIALTAQEPRSGTKKAMRRCPPIVARMGSLGWNGAEMVVGVVGAGGRIHSQKREKRSEHGRAEGEVKSENRTMNWPPFSNSTQNQFVLHCTINSRSAVTNLCCGARQMTAGKSERGDWRFISPISGSMPGGTQSASLNHRERTEWRAGRLRARYRSAEPFPGSEPVQIKIAKWPLRKIEPSTGPPC